jgi:hypothetical protein
MNPFDAEYPRRLQQVIDHARRFVALLSSADAPQSERGRVWLTGRVEEIQTIFAELVGDWRGGRLPETAAVAAMSSYLGALHEGAEQHLGTAVCCVSDRATMIPLTPYGGEDAATADTLPGYPGLPGDSRRPGS